ncbi:hypothetical protein DFH09DRAFT_1157730, partial [Mycena vulgaris]
MYNTRSLKHRIPKTHSCFKSCPSVTTSCRDANLSLIHHQIHQRIPPRRCEVARLELMTAHHHSALAQPRQNLPHRPQGQLLRDEVDEQMGNMLTHQLAEEIILVLVEVVRQPAHMLARRDSVERRGFDQPDVVVDADAVDGRRARGVRYAVDVAQETDEELSVAASKVAEDRQRFGRGRRCRKEVKPHKRRCCSHGAWSGLDVWCKDAGI